MSEQPQQPSQPPQPPQPGYGYPGAGPYGGGQPGPYGYPPQYQQHPGFAGPVPPGTYTGDPNAPYGYDVYGRPYSDKSKIVAGVLQFVLGCFGVGRFYTGHVGLALGQLFTCGGLGIWALIDAILLLTGDHTDAQGRVLRG